MQGCRKGFWIQYEDGPRAAPHVHSALLTESVHISGSRTHTHTYLFYHRRTYLTSLPAAATRSLNLDLVCTYTVIDIHELFLSLQHLNTLEDGYIDSCNSLIR